jgi:immunoglobulin-like protein involved in spore germination
VPGPHGALAGVLAAGVLVCCAMAVATGCTRKAEIRGPLPIDTSSTAPPDKSTALPPAFQDTTGIMIRVTAPTALDLVTSPLVVRGQARGPWYFEASFPVRLVDDLGYTIAAVPAQAKGDWMTPYLVPFEATLTFTTSAKIGKVVFERSNPSGLPENADSVEVPVRFRIKA